MQQGWLSDIHYSKGEHEQQFQGIIWVKFEELFNKVWLEKDEKKIALFYFLSGKDVSVNVPTGFGKSLIYQLALLVVE